MAKKIYKVTFPKKYVGGVAIVRANSPAEAVKKVADGHIMPEGQKGITVEVLSNQDDVIYLDMGVSCGEEN